LLLEINAQFEQTLPRSRMAEIAHRSTQSLGHFEVIRELGRSGIRVIYDARIREHGKPNAIIIEGSSEGFWEEK
jgi:hypothetical protein